VSPHETLRRGKVAHISNPANEWDPKCQRTLSPRGWAKTGGQGGKAPYPQGDFLP